MFKRCLNLRWTHTHNILWENMLWQMHYIFMIDSCPQIFLSWKADSTNVFAFWMYAPGLLGNLLSMAILRSPNIDMKVSPNIQNLPNVLDILKYVMEMEIFTFLLTNMYVLHVPYKDCPIIYGFHFLPQKSTFYSLICRFWILFWIQDGFVRLRVVLCLSWLI